MEYKEFHGLKLSALGFGTMRFPLHEDGTINEELTEKLIDYAYENGVNYYDTAFPYLDGKSEGVTAKCLSKYPRESYYLADKMPAHQFIENIDPPKIFEMELERLNTDYIDFYLLHNVNDSCLDIYTDEKIGIVRYLLEEKKKGRIRYLGFSAHATLEVLARFLTYCSEHGYTMDFCQLEMNYLDWTLQRGKEKIELLNRYGIPVWVMEPCRGGKLANLSEKNHARLAELEPGRSDASWAFRWLMGIPEVKVILSGMNSEEQVEDNIKTFSEYRKLDPEEEAVLMEIAEGLKKSVPCTSCRYCTQSCPQKIDIPFMLYLYNEYMVDEGNMEPSALMSSVPAGSRPEACIGCGECAKRCPQHIDIPDKMTKLSELAAKGADWKAICRQRNALANM